MSAFKLYQIFYLIMIGVSIYMYFKTRKQKAPIQKKVLRLFFFSTLDSLFYLLSVSISSALCSDIFSSLLFVSMDFTMFCILNFVIEFTNYRFQFKCLDYVQRVIFGFLCFDSLLLITNPIHHYCLTYYPVEALGRTIYLYDVKLPFEFHLVFCYLLLIATVGILIIKSIHVPKEYRSKFTNVIINCVGLSLLNLIFLALGSKIPVDISYPFYSICVCIIYRNTFQYSNGSAMNGCKRLILEYINSPVALFDYEEILVDCNELFLKIFPFAKDYPIIPLSLNDFQKKAGVTFPQNKGDAPALCVYEKDGQTYKYHGYINNFSDKKNHTLGHTLILNDVTRELEAIQEAEEAVKIKSVFLSNMSHEIRTPINAVLGMDELILRENENAQIKEYAENIKSAGNVLLSLINDILDISKIESGSMNIVPTVYTIENLVNSLHAIIDLRAKQKNLFLRFDINPHMPSALEGDEVRIQQCITNILTNAVKYTHEGTVCLTLDYELLSENTILLKVSVKDTGMGIKKEDLHKLFKSFQRLDEKKNRNIEGTGLGLNLTKQLVELMGGEIGVNSIYGEGTTFYFSLPQKVANPEAIDLSLETHHSLEEKAEEYQASFVAANRRILVVDDNKVNLALIKGLLKETKLQIDTALSAKEGLELTQNNKYDCLFLDHLMPEIDGIEMMNILKQKTDNPNSDTPSIALTANVFTGAEQFYKENGFYGYLSKPVDSKLLEATLRTILYSETKEAK